MQIKSKNPKYCLSSHVIYYLPRIPFQPFSIYYLGELINWKLKKSSWSLHQIWIKNFLQRRNLMAFLCDTTSSLKFKVEGWRILWSKLTIGPRPLWSSISHRDLVCSRSLCVSTTKGGFQMEFVSISRVMNHMTCYKFKCTHWWKIYSFLRAEICLTSRRSRCQKAHKTYPFLHVST